MWPHRARALRCTWRAAIDIGTVVLTPSMSPDRRAPTRADLLVGESTLTNAVPELTCSSKTNTPPPGARAPRAPPSRRQLRRSSATARTRPVVSCRSSARTRRPSRARRRRRSPSCRSIDRSAARGRASRSSSRNDGSCAAARTAIARSMASWPDDGGTPRRSFEQAVHSLRRTPCVGEQR